MLSMTKLHLALESGRSNEASELIKSYREDVLIKCFENYESYSPPSYKSNLHIIAGLKDKQQAVRLCQELLDNVNEAENRERLLNATVVYEVRLGEEKIRVRVAAIHIAAYKGNAGVVRMLSREYGVDVNCSTSEILKEPPLTGLTPLYWATVNGQTEVVKLLLDNNADVNASCSDDGVTPLHIAGCNGHTEVLKLLLENNADVNARRTDNGATPLHIAAFEGHAEVVKLLLDSNADVNASCTNDGATPLYIAAQQGHTVVVKLLLENNADVNACRTDDGTTPLYVTAGE